MDIKDWQLDDDKVNKIASLLKNWNLYHFCLNMSNVNLTDNQFEDLLSPLKNMSNLEILHLILENTDMNDYKRHALQRLIRDMKNLRSVHINVRSNKISRDALHDFRSLLEPIPIRQFLWDDDLLF
jgi:EAL domain-containing protein (putative c-di-GMP-specific phosphodiesterase class I)